MQTQDVTSGITDAPADPARQGGARVRGSCANPQIFFTTYL